VAIEGKIIVGMSYKDISSHLQEMYGLEVSSGTLAANAPDGQRMAGAAFGIDLSHRLARCHSLQNPGEWPRSRPCRLHDPSLNLEGKKEVLGLYLSENEGARFGLQVLTDLSNRGVSDILMACIDGLKGFPEAIESIFPKTEVQLCIVHQIRNSLKYIVSKDQKAFMSDLKRVYRASNKEFAL